MSWIGIQKRLARATCLGLGIGAALLQGTASAALDCNTLYGVVGPDNTQPGTGKSIVTINPVTGAVGSVLYTLPSTTANGNVSGGIGISNSNSLMYIFDGNGGTGYGGVGRIYSFNGTVMTNTGFTFPNPTIEHQIGADKSGVLWGTVYNGAKNLAKFDPASAANMTFVDGTSTAGAANAITAADTTLQTEWNNLAEGDFAFDNSDVMWFISTAVNGAGNQVALWLVDRTTRKAYKVGNYGNIGTRFAKGGEFFGGQLYIGTTDTDTVAANNAQVLKFDPATRTLTTLNFAFGVNDTGLTTSDSIHDMATCVYPTLTDSSDGPASYGVALHAIWNNVHIGSSVPDAETPTTSINSDGDDTTGIDDETVPVANVVSGQAYTLSVPVLNNSASNATLIGWIDFNQDGVFQSTEAASSTLSTNAASQTATLSWTAAQVGTKTGASVLRLRLSTDSVLTTSTPSGLATDGEAQDYAITLVPTRIGLAKTRSAVTNNGDGTYSVTYTLLVRNYTNPSAALSSVQVTDSLTAFGTYTATNPPVTAGQYTLSSAPAVSGVTNSAALSANAGFNGSSNTNLLTTATTNTLPSGGAANTNRSSALIAFTVKFRPVTTSSLTVDNTATASAAGGVTDVSDTQITDTTPATAGVVSSLEPDPNSDGNPSTAGEARPTPFVLTFAPSLKITKSHVGNFVVGDSGSYTLTVTNTGTANTTGTLEIKDLLPANMVLGSISTSSGSLSAPTTASGVTTLTLTPAAGGIAPGGTVTLTVNFSLPINEAANGSGFIVYDQFPNATNYASVGGGGDTVTAAPAPGAGCADATHCASDPTTVKPKDIPSPQVCTARGGTRGANLLTEGDFGTSSSTVLPTFGPALGILPGDVVGPSTIYKYIDLGTGVNAVAAAAGQGNNGPGSPEDGEYTIVNSSRARSGSAWYHVLDHTTATPSGRFMMINAADTTTGGVFYQKQVTVTPNTNYDFSFWMMNVIAVNAPLLPNIQLEFEFNDGRVEVVGTGSIPNTDKPLWREYAAVINSGNATQMTVRFKNLAIGGSGNDLALDDLTFRPCTFTTTTSISGTVFVDSTPDGTISAGETGRLSDVQVQLVDQDNSNAVIAIVRTDASGNYTFSNIPTGRKYTVQVNTDTTVSTTLAGYTATLPTPPSRDLGLVASSQTGKNFGFIKANELAVSKLVQSATSPFGAITVRNDGQSFRYLLSVQNQGSVPQIGVQVSDALPSGVVLDTPPAVFRKNGTVDATQSYSAGVWSAGTLAAGDTATLELYVKLSSGGSQTGIVNTATLLNPPAGDNVGNNSSSASILPNPVKLKKYVRNVTGGEAVDTTRVSTTAKPGNTLEYCVEASTTLTTALSVNVSDTLVANQTFVSGSITGASPSNFTSPTVTGTLVGVVSGTPKTMCFRTTVN